MTAPPASLHVILLQSIVSFTLANLTFSPASFSAEPASISVGWREDLATAQAEARERDLPLWVQFTGPWCINCRRMDRDTFHHSKIIEQSRDNFIPIKLRSDVHEQLALSLGLSALPATVIVRPSGEVILSMEGYANPDELDGFLLQSLTRDGRSTKAERLARARNYVEPKLALAGYCPVSLVAEKKLEAGKEPVSVVHDGRVYRFADESKRRDFVTSPERFVPRHAGLDPVSQVDQAELKPGDPRYGMIYRGQLFLFVGEASRKAFTTNPQRYARMQFRPTPEPLDHTSELAKDPGSMAIAKRPSREWLGHMGIVHTLRGVDETRTR